MADVNGKKLEIKISNWLKKQNIYHKRIYDSKSMGQVSSAQPADLFIVYNRVFLYIETKHCQGNTFSLDRIRTSQFQGYFEFSKYPDERMDYLLLIEFEKGIYIIPMSVIVDYIETVDKKSISEKDCEGMPFAEYITDSADLKRYLLEYTEKIKFI